MKMSRNDIKKARNDIKKARDDIKKARPVDFWSVSPANALSMALGVTHYTSVSYGKIDWNRSAVRDQKVAF